jgi:hypothetical protein
MIKEREQLLRERAATGVFIEEERALRAKDFRGRPA